MNATPPVPPLRVELCYVVQMGEIQHGKASSYTNHRCRCDECRSAWAVMIADRKARRALEPTPERVHGTQNGYGNYGCRCESCTQAWTVASLERSRRRRSAGSQVANIGKSNFGRGKISPEAAVAIRKGIETGKRISDLAVEYGVTVNAIYLVRDGKIATAAL